MTRKRLLEPAPGFALAVAVLAATSLVVLHMSRGTRGEPLLDPTRVSDASLLRIEHDDRSALELRRSGERWLLTDPPNALADNAAVERLLLGLIESLARAEETRMHEGVASPAAAGLDRPRPTIMVQGAAFSHRIMLGDAASDGRIFARLDDGPVLLVDPNARFRLDKRAFDLRERRLFRQPRASIRSVTIDLATRSYLLTRRAQGWTVSFGQVEDGGYEATVRADIREVERLLNRLTSLRAIRFPEAGELPRIDFASPSAMVTIEMEGGDSLEIAVAEERLGGVRRFFAVDGALGGVVEVNADAVRYLRMDPGSLRHRNMMETDLTRVHRLELIRPEQTIVLERATPGVGRWRMSEPYRAEVEAWRLSGILHTLSNLKAETIIEDEVSVEALSTHGLATPSHRVRLFDESGGLLAHLDIGSESAPGHRYALGSARPYVSTISEAHLANLPRTASDLVR